MYCCFKRSSKSKKPVNEVPQKPKGHTQSPDSQIEPPPRSRLSSGTRARSPPTDSPTIIEQDSFPLRSDHSSELDSNNTHEPAHATVQQSLLLPGGEDSGVHTVYKLDEAVQEDAKPRRDLWEEAFAKLDKDERNQFSAIEEPQGPKVVAKVAKQTEELYFEHEKTGWEATFKKSFESALKSVLSCRELISASLASDPTGHAAAAWTIVSLGLQMTQNELDRRQHILQACELLAESLVLLAATEESYRRRNVRDSDSLEDTIVVVYVAIFKLSLEIVHENELSAGHKVLNSLTKMAERRLKELKDTLIDAQKKLSMWTNIVEQQYHTREGTHLKEKVDSTFAKITALAQQISNIVTRSLTEEEQKLLDWLSKYPFSNSQNSEAFRRLAGTGAWVLSLPEYREWKTSRSSLL